MMNSHKVIATLSWTYNTDLSPEEAYKYAKIKLETIIVEKGLKDFNYDLFISIPKEDRQTIHLKEFGIEEVFPYITEQKTRRDFVVGDKVYSVKMSSQRYQVFKNNTRCVACGIEGTRVFLDINPGDVSPHFNFYGEEDGDLIMMTKDHIKPKSKDGPDEMENFATCCAICNNLKGNDNLSYIQVNELRNLYRNTTSLPKKELNKLIQIRRQEMIQLSAGFSFYDDNNT